MKARHQHPVTYRTALFFGACLAAAIAAAPQA